MSICVLKFPPPKKKRSGASFLGLLCTPPGEARSPCFERKKTHSETGIESPRARSPARKRGSPKHRVQVPIASQTERKKAVAGLCCPVSKRDLSSSQSRSPQFAPPPVPYNHHLSHNQNQSIKWSTQNHVKSGQRRQRHPFLDYPIYPGFHCGSNPARGLVGKFLG